MKDGKILGTRLLFIVKDPKTANGVFVFFGFEVT
jgi:hypothetical protein